MRRIQTRKGTQAHHPIDPHPLVEDPEQAEEGGPTVPTELASGPFEIILAIKPVLPVKAGISDEKLVCGVVVHVPNSAADQGRDGYSNYRLSEESVKSLATAVIPGLRGAESQPGSSGIEITRAR